MSTHEEKVKTSSYSNDNLVEIYLQTKRSRELIKEREDELFSVILLRSSAGNMNCNDHRVTVKHRENVTVDAAEAEKIIGTDLCPVENFGIDIFSKKYTVKKAAFAELQENEPEYCAKVLSSAVTVKDGKPVVTIKTSNPATREIMQRLMGAEASR